MINFNIIKLIPGSTGITRNGNKILNLTEQSVGIYPIKGILFYPQYPYSNDICWTINGGYKFNDEEHPLDIMEVFPPIVNIEEINALSSIDKEIKKLNKETLTNLINSITPNLELKDYISSLENYLKLKSV